jgi:hypothetical protein
LICKKAIGALILVLIVILSVGGSLANAASDVTRTVSFKTNYGAILHVETFTIPGQTLSYDGSLSHPYALLQYPNGYSMDYSQYVTPDLVRDIAVSVASVAAFGEEDIADTVLSFVQNLGYANNAYAISNTLYPVETLATGGVCDDLSVLYATLMVSLGFRAILIWYPKQVDLGGSKATHVNVGIHLSAPPEHASYGTYTYFTANGDNYYVAEATGDGLRVGDEPPILQNTSDYVEEAPLPISPLVIFTMTATVTQTQTQHRTVTSVTTSTTTEPFLKSSDTVPVLASFLAALALVGISGFWLGRRKMRPIAEHGVNGSYDESARAMSKFCRECGSEMPIVGAY